MFSECDFGTAAMRQKSLTISKVCGSQTIFFFLPQPLSRYACYVLHSTHPPDPSRLVYCFIRFLPAISSRFQYYRALRDPYSCHGAYVIYALRS